MHPDPGGMIATQAQYSLEPQSTDAILLPDNMPDCPKPQLERLSRVLKDGAGGYGCLEIALTATVQISL